MIVLFYYAVFGISCYYTVISFILRYPAGLNHATNPFVFALLIAAALLFALGKTTQMRTLLTAALLLPTAALYFYHGVPEILEYIPPWGYLIYLSFCRPRTLSHSYFKADFSHILWGLTVMFPFLLFRPEKGITALYEAAPYLIIFLVAGVFLLQTLRHKEEVKGLVRHQSRQTAAFFIFCILLTAGRLLSFLENILLKKILIPAGLFLIDHFLALVQYIRKLFFTGNAREQKKTFLDYLEYVDKIIKKGEVKTEQAPLPPQMMEREEINYMLIVVLLAALAALIIFLVLKGNTKKRTQREIVLDEREALIPKNNEKRMGRRDISQETIRKTYQNFMRLTNGASHKLKAQDTTQEIQDKYMHRKCISEKKDIVKKQLLFAEELTGIYRQVRYRGTDEDFVKQGDELKRDAKRAKILLDYLKKM